MSYFVGLIHRVLYLRCTLISRNFFLIFVIIIFLTFFVLFVTFLLRISFRIFWRPWLWSWRSHFSGEILWSSLNCCVLFGLLERQFFRNFLLLNFCLQLFGGRFVLFLRSWWCCLLIIYRGILEIENKWYNYLIVLRSK